MAKKKSSESFRPEKLVLVNSEDIFGKPVSKREGTRLDRLKAMPESEIDYSDIPQLTEAQLKEFKRPAPKTQVAVRLDRDVYDWLREGGDGYSTRINGILRAVMAQQRRPS